jgi:hypothetical protein
LPCRFGSSVPLRFSRMLPPDDAHRSKSAFLLCGLGGFEFVTKGETEGLAKAVPGPVDNAVAVTEATSWGNGWERVDENGAATATASPLVALLEPILEEYAEEARFLSNVKADLDVSRIFLDAPSETCLIVLLQVRSSRCRAVWVLRPAPFLKNVTCRRGAPKQVGVGARLQGLLSKSSTRIPEEPKRVVPHGREHHRSENQDDRFRVNHRSPCRVEYDGRGKCAPTETGPPRTTSETSGRIRTAAAPSAGSRCAP